MLETRPQLLVSVRTYREFQQACSLGVDIVDFKEPRHGPLSPADSLLWLRAATQFERTSIANRPQLSAALGEAEEAATVASRVPDVFDFAKVGPSGCRSKQSLAKLWSATRKLLPEAVELVAVAYADFEAARTLAPEEVFAIAQKCGFRRCLIDTFEKDGRSAVDVLGLPRLQRLSDDAKESNLWWALAGSVRLEDEVLCGTADIFPSCFAVRGDVCDGGRETTLSAEKVRRWQAALSSGPVQTG